MLSPDNREIYTSALTPPDGFTFDTGLATTFSLDPAVLLSIPLEIALGSISGKDETDPIALLEGLRSIANRLTVFVDRGRTHVPKQANQLYGLLESMISEVRAPLGGSFHPKMWLLRFIDNDSDEPLLRLLILSRNITADNSWDICMQIEGYPTGRNVAGNKALFDLITKLPEYCVEKLTKNRKKQIGSLANECRRTKWNLPEGFETLEFITLGDGRAFKPEWTDELAIISPWVGESALRQLSASTENLRIIISRSEDLDTHKRDLGKLAKKWHCLSERAEIDDGEEASNPELIGLHAKVYIGKRGWDTHIYIGSANATNVALVRGSNVELLAHLTGKKSRIGSIDTLLGSDGLGPFLYEYDWDVEPPEADKQKEKAQKLLEKARETIINADIELECCEVSTDRWKQSLKTNSEIKLKGVDSFVAWPLTVRNERAVDCLGLSPQKELSLGQYSKASLSTLIAFSISSNIVKLSLQFVLCLPITGLPEDRDDEILRSIIKDKESFLRYLMLLLGKYGNGFPVLKKHSTGGSGGYGKWRVGTPLLEDMIRTLSRDPERLEAISNILVKLKSNEESDDTIVPGEFKKLWESFDEILRQTIK